MVDFSAQQQLLLSNRQYQMLVLTRAHAMAADRYEKLHLWIGIPVIILTTLVGSVAFATLSDQSKTHVWIAVVTGILSISAAVLAAIQSFLSYGSRAQKHIQASAQLNGLYRRLDTLWRLRTSEKAAAELVAVDTELNQILATAPRVSIELQQKAKEAIEAEKQTYKTPADLMFEEAAEAEVEAERKRRPIYPITSAPP